MTNDVVLLKKNIIDYIARFNKENLTLNVGDFISAKIDEKTFLITPVKINPNELEEENLLILNINDTLIDEYTLFREIYRAREDISAIIHTHFNFSVIVSKAKVKVPPVLDDMAQILGPSIDYSTDKASKNVLKAMKGRNACFISFNGTIACGRTVDEAHTASLVLEKASKVFVEASALGGAVAINKFEAKLMHYVYKKKYSKKDQEAKIADLKVSK
jgi:L-fuculose-phosphate aldolase